jgi:hypothetical protein
LKVKATPEGAEIKGYLDPSILNADSCLLTTGQTLACMLVGNKKEPLRLDYITPLVKS